MDLVLDRISRAEDVTLEFTVYDHHEGRLRLMLEVITGQEIGEKVAICKDRIDRVP